MTPDPTGPGQTSVWSYPRPPVAVTSHAHVVVAHRGNVIADTRAAIRTLETSHPPTWYLPPECVAPGVLRPSARTSFCEWKGVAHYFDVTVASARFADAAWSYPDPALSFAALRDHVAFYAAPFDTVTVDGVQVAPQPGGFYGGWITPDVTGPFKGVPGSLGW